MNALAAPGNSACWATVAAVFSHNKRRVSLHTLSSTFPPLHTFIRLYIYICIFFFRFNIGILFLAPFSYSSIALTQYALVVRGLNVDVSREYTTVQNTMYKYVSRGESPNTDEPVKKKNRGSINTQRTTNDATGVTILSSIFYFFYFMYDVVLFYFFFLFLRNPRGGRSTWRTPPSSLGPVLFFY